MEPWYKVVTPRKEVREGRSFNPDEFAIALEKVVAHEAPEDYQDPVQFFSRTCFTRALCDNSGMVLRRLAGRTDNASPVQTLVTQMGGGKTHMLTALWHLANGGPEASSYPGVEQMLASAGVTEAPKAKVAVYVGTAWDSQEGSETPWIDMARQLAGEEGVKALGPRAKDDPPGGDTLDRIFEMAGGRVLLLFDEVLNGFSRHKWLAEPMHAFFHSIVRTLVGSHEKSAVFSLPRSEVEMTDFDLKWQDKIVKTVGAVAKPLLVNDEAEISEVIRRRLFQDLGSERTRRNVARAFADWCFERRAQLPPEWTAVDTAATEKKAREFLQSRFEACYPFHPATLSVFQRKWAALPQFQATRGTLAMLAQWISVAAQDGFRKARTEPLITLGSAPLHDPAFKSVVLGQLGEPRLNTAVDTDIAGGNSHARALDADTKGALREIHRRVGAAILFESSGGQRDKVAHLPELRFALGEPEVDTTSVDNAAIALEGKSFFIQRVGADGFKIYYKAKIDKAVHDRRASLDEASEIKPAIKELVKEEFKRGASTPTHLFESPFDGTIVSDTPRLSLWAVDPDEEWNAGGNLRNRIADWTKNRGKSSRLYPGALVWCVRKPGRDLRDKVELWLAWKRVQKDVRDGVLGSDYEKADLREIEVKVKDAEEQAKDEVWGGYRFVVLADNSDPSGLKVIDLGAGHSSGSETLCGRVIAALKAEALLNESVGAGYIDRNWPPAFKDTGAWPLASLRQSFLNGALTRLLDPDTVLRGKIVEFVGRGDFGLASGPKPDSTYERVWFCELVPSDEVAFEPGVLLLKKDKAEALKKPPGPPTPEAETPEPTVPTPEPKAGPGPEKLRSGEELKIGVSFEVSVDTPSAGDLRAELRQILSDLGLEGSVTVD